MTFFQLLYHILLYLVIRQPNAYILILYLCMSYLQQEKPKLIDPLDYEAVICELGDELKEDPLRDLLLFPDNDFSVSVCVI